MARIKCPKCGKPMKKDGAPAHVLGSRITPYRCPDCERTRLVAEGSTYESPSAKRMRLGKEKRLADRWQKKIGGG